MQGKKRDKDLAYYLPSEVALHNGETDCWNSCFGYVYDLSEYMKRIDPENPIAKYIRAFAGRDVSFWFDPRGRRCGCETRLNRYVDPSDGVSWILLPFGNPLPEGVKSKMVPIAKDSVCLCGCCAGTFNCKSPDRGDCNCCSCARAKDSSDGGGGGGLPEDLTGKCWTELERIFNGEELLIGRLTKKSRPCRITNVLTGLSAVISVCEEDSIDRIRERADLFNRHGASYTWKFEGKLLDMTLTLTENGIPDESERYLACGLPDDLTTYVPNLTIYYNDDLTEHLF